MNHRLNLRCDEENNDYRHGELGIFTGKINPQLTIERKCWVFPGRRMEIKMHSHNVVLGHLTVTTAYILLLDCTYINHQ